MRGLVALMIELGKLPLLNDYSLCQDTVTVYHEENGEVTRTVHERAYLDFKKTENIDRTGSAESNGFLLVIPGDVQACYVGDKVMLGEGPQVPDAEVLKWWRTFIPTKVDGLVVVKYVDMKRWGGRYVHTEAGG